jgi:ribonucleotide reductase alpha subunit
VRVTDDFMEAVQKDREWALRSPRDPNVIVQTVKARDLWRDIATAAWECGDPGLQYDTTVNAWHTSSGTGAHQRVQPVQRVHVPRRFGVQPGVAEPAQVRQPRGQPERR